ncbi:hypothetical protein RFI_01553 [Reticulomyxa filosa]|uniref:PUM-HD domain-containing protein n=1 Tax=Reticulomyxa filosa TaxID=46433 RepID=X6PBS6_RETFI|nr:hypothetical protein RFI_01553 [Reticulomyxa filosa]|eukprot:ETO35509.1 hypothetical protein RFI_01553 [Reticulomyxa filosa]
MTSEPSNLTLHNTNAGMSGDTNPDLNNTNTQLLTQLLAQQQPLVNSLHWNVLGSSAHPVSGGANIAPRSNMNSKSNATNGNTTIGVGLTMGSGVPPVAITTQSPNSHYGNVNVGPLMNDLYNTHFPSQRTFNLILKIKKIIKKKVCKESNGSCKTKKTIKKHDSTMFEMSGNLYYLSRHQDGCRLVQEKLRDSNNFNAIYSELCPHLSELMMDNFGHYVVETLFTQASDLKKLEMLKMIEQDIGTVACHKQGSFSIQSLMERITHPEQMEQFVKMLQSDIKKIILNNSGHFVILRYLQRHKYPWTRFIHKAIMSYPVEFATDHYGLRVMKSAMDTGPAEEMIGVYNAIVKHTNELVENQYGNYIVQHLLDIGPRPITDGIKEKMHGKFVRYSKQKFSSNVVEKCLRHSHTESKCENPNPKDWTAIIVRELCSKAEDLISDKYGNYCLQTALQTATANSALLDEFARNCRLHLDNLRENVKAKWIKLLNAAIAKNRVTNQTQKDLKYMWTFSKKKTKYVLSAFLLSIVDFLKCVAHFTIATTFCDLWECCFVSIIINFLFLFWKNLASKSQFQRKESMGICFKKKEM